MEARIISMILSKAPRWEPQKAAAASGTHARKGAKPETLPDATTPAAATDAPPAEATPDTTSATEQTPSTPS